jgi:hypothetical protein
VGVRCFVVGVPPSRLILPPDASIGFLKRQIAYGLQARAAALACTLPLQAAVQKGMSTGSRYQGCRLPEKSLP